MTLAFLLLVILFARLIDILWLPALFCAVAAMHWAASLHLADPLAPLYAFGLAALAARTVLALAIDGVVASLRRHRPRPAPR